MAMAMAGSFAVSAATIAITDADTSETATGIQVADTGTAMVKVPFTTDITDQLTVLLYKVDTANDLGPNEGNIGYINQVAANDTTGVIVTETVGEGDEAKTVTSFSFPMNDDNVADGKIKPGTYKILVGGTGITTAMEAGVLVVEEAQVTVKVWGDVNDSGAVDLGDAILLLRKTVNPDVELNESLADVNASGAIDLGDAVLILRKTVNPDLEFPAEAAQ